MTERNKRVAELLDIIGTSHAELRIIREACPHPSYHLVHWDYGVGRIYPVRCCDACLDAIPGITDAEREELGPLFKGSGSGWTVIDGINPAEPV